jgi:hypothetical protein
MSPKPPRARPALGSSPGQRRSTLFLDITGEPGPCTVKLSHESDEYVGGIVPREPAYIRTLATMETQSLKCRLRIQLTAGPTGLSRTQPMVKTTPAITRLNFVPVDRRGPPCYSEPGIKSGGFLVQV